jgi:predicted esterase
MPKPRWNRLLALALLPALAPSSMARGGTVTLKNGTVYRGVIDKDNTIVSVYDGLSRVVINDTKVARITNDPDTKYELFRLKQPLEVHGGVMPITAVAIKASAWDKFGRRQFEYVGPRSSKPVKMTQVINVLGPKVSHIRGNNGFWVGQIPTSQIPKAVVLGLISQVDQKNVEYRLGVNRFLLQAEWFPEARAELDRLAKDFPDQAEKAADVKRLVDGLEAAQLLAEIKVRDRAQQPREVLSRLRAFPTNGAASDVVVEVRNLLRRAEAQADEDKALVESLRRTLDELPAADRKAARSRLVEILAALADAPDAVRDRFDPFRKADRKLDPADRFALALSGWVAGAEGAVADAKAAEALWSARDALREYLASDAEDVRKARADTLRGLELPDPESKSPRKLGLDDLTRMIRLMPPPLRDAREEADPGKVRLLRVRNDPNPDQPTEYAVALPPEYHPLRSYPTVVALHAGDGPKAAVAWWAAEAARRGYIVVAPEYNLRGQDRDYRYTPSEHAAVELALRDARRRFAVDSDRVYLGGQVLGANMAWDFGLAHPDLFAGVAIVNGIPAKYVWAYKDTNAKKVPLYVAMGDLAPAENPVIFELGKGLVARNFDVTYVEHFRRGLEDLPEECPAIFDWMSHRRRDPYPSDFLFSTARSCDERFYGIVVREFSPKSVMEPPLVDELGKKLKPATVGLDVRRTANLLLLTANGIRRLDLWIGPKQVDFAKKVEVRIKGGPTLFRDMVRPELEPFLEDIRLRGDRQQVYGAKVPLDIARRRPI